MKFVESFVVTAERAVVWDFFENHRETVGMCIPGAESVTAQGPDRYRVVVTQKVGSVGATFDLRASVEEADPLERMALKAVGRSIKGARGDLRARAVVTLTDEEGGTRVDLDADVALGGMLGSMGHKVIAQRADELTGEFAAALADEIHRAAGVSPP